MENRSKLLDEFTRTFDDIDEAEALELLDLSEGDRTELAAGLEALPSPVQAACRVVLADWQKLDAPGRVAALLVLANALADAALERDHPR